MTCLRKQKAVNMFRKKPFLHFQNCNSNWRVVSTMENNSHVISGSLAVSHSTVIEASLTDNNTCFWLRSLEFERHVLFLPCQSPPILSYRCRNFSAGWYQYHIAHRIGIEKVVPKGSRLSADGI